MVPFQSPLSMVTNLALLPVAMIILVVFALRERWAPVPVHASNSRRA